MASIANLSSFFQSRAAAAQAEEAPTDPSGRLLAALARQSSVILSDLPQVMGLEYDKAIDIVEGMRARGQVVARERDGVRFLTAAQAPRG